ncbi:MAG: hypothetical protein FWH20_10920 [Oscillospiraceae bacterium]|nr:hypothetical protein [Oscillospiraceae bacterium]
MRTLVVYYSKTGTTKRVAEAVVAAKGCDFVELQFDEKTQTMSAIDPVHNPAEYERVILLAPVWAFALATPMKMYIAEHKSAIAAMKNYDLIVTCGGWGLRGCVRNCRRAIGKPPETALIFKAKQVKRGEFDIRPLV